MAGPPAGIVGTVAQRQRLLVFSRSDTVTFAGDISGSGAVKKMGSNTTILTGSQQLHRRHHDRGRHLADRQRRATGSIAGNVVNDGGAPPSTAA